MKNIIQKILKENDENNLEQRFRNSMQKFQYIFESSLSSDVDSVEISEIQIIPKYPYIEGKLTVKSYFEDHDFGAIGRRIDLLEDEVYEIIRQFTFTEKGGLIKRGPNNDWTLNCAPIGMKWDSYGDDPFMITLEFIISQDEYDA
jgi:uncharacterized protein YutD